MEVLINMKKEFRKSFTMDFRKYVSLFYDWKHNGRMNYYFLSQNELLWTNKFLQWNNPTLKIVKIIVIVMTYSIIPLGKGINF